MAFGFESGIDPDFLRSLQVGVSGFVLVMVMIMFHNTVTKIQKSDDKPKNNTDEIRRKIQEARQRKNMS